MRVLGHPLHPMLIVFPLGLLPVSLAFDVTYLLTGDGFWAQSAFWLIVAGAAGGLAAGVPGALDWLAIPRYSRAFQVGLLHGGGNLVVLALFLLSALWRWQITGLSAPGPVAIGLSAGGVGLALVTGWLGGELVDRLGVGVDHDAHVDASSSLSRGTLIAFSPPRHRAPHEEPPEEAPRQDRAA